MANDQELDFLWKLFYLHLTGAPDALLCEHINSMYETLLELDGVFESTIDSFALNRDGRLLDSAIVEALNRRSFSAKRHVLLVARMVGTGRISLIAGADLLEMRRSDQETLPEAVEHVLDVAWLINEDRRDGVMEADKDHLLWDALASVATDFRLDVDEGSSEERGQIRHPGTS